MIARLIGSAVAALVLSMGVPEEPPDLESILKAARETQESDLASWSRFQFRRQVVREKLKASGETKDREVLEFVLTPEGDAFDETLVLLDGVQPKPSAVESHRKKARFSNHYKTALSGEGVEEASGGGSLTLGFLLRISTHRYEGREVIDGYPCHRLDFSPPEDEKGGGDLPTRIGRSMAGSLWITEDGHHLIRARAETVKPVTFALFLGRVSSLAVELEGMPVGDRTWLPRRIEIRTEVRIIGIPTRRRNEYTYSDYALVR